MAAEIVCPFCDRGLPLPEGTGEGDTLACPRCAGSRLRVVRQNGTLSARIVPTASCAVCGNVIDLPDSIRPGENITHCDILQTVDREMGAYALTPAPKQN